jgi:limonene-1,2-epoxide hydrolase
MVESPTGWGTDMTNVADRFAFLKDELKRLSDEMEKVRREILDTGLERIEGEHAVVVVSLYERTTFSSTKAKAFLTADQIAACESVVLCERIDPKPLLADIIV